MSHIDDGIIKRKRESFSSDNSSPGIHYKKPKEADLNESYLDSGSFNLSTTSLNMSGLAQQSVSKPSVIISPPSPLSIPPSPLDSHGSHNTQHDATKQSTSATVDPATQFDLTNPAIKATNQLQGSPDRNAKVFKDLLIEATDRFESTVRREINVNNTTLLNTIRSELVDQVSTQVYNGIKHDLEVENEALRNRCSHLEEEMGRVKENQHAVFEIMSKKCVQYDQQARRCNMRILGIKEYPNENSQYLKFVLIDLIAQRLNINIPDHVIESIHRIGNPIPGKSRSIICTFVRSDVKFDVMKNRKYLKGTGVSFTEDLCPDLQDIHDSIKGHINIQSVWAWNGRVQAKDKYDKIHTLSFGTDWLDFFDNLKPPGPRPFPPKPRAGGSHSALPATTAQSTISSAADTPPLSQSLPMHTDGSHPTLPATSTTTAQSTISTAAATPSLSQPLSMDATVVTSNSVELGVSTAATSTSQSVHAPIPSLLAPATTNPQSSSAGMQTSAAKFLDIGSGFHSSQAPAVTGQIYPSLNGMGATASDRYIQPLPNQRAQDLHFQTPTQRFRGPQHDLPRNSHRSPVTRGMRPVRNSTPHPRNIPRGQPLVQGFFQRLPHFGT